MHARTCFPKVTFSRVRELGRCEHTLGRGLLCMAGLVWIQGVSIGSGHTNTCGLADVDGQLRLLPESCSVTCCS